MPSNFGETILRNRPTTKAAPPPAPAATVPATAFSVPEQPPVEMVVLRRVFWERVKHVTFYLFGGFGLNILAYLFRWDRLVFVPCISVAILLVMWLVECRSANHEVRAKALVRVLEAAIALLASMPVTVSILEAAKNAQSV